MFAPEHRVLLAELTNNLYQGHTQQLHQQPRDGTLNNGHDHFEITFVKSKPALNIILSRCP